MKKRLLTLTLVLIFIGLFTGTVTAMCPESSVHVQVPAVIGEEDSDLLNIYIDVIDGNGMVYTSIKPMVGMSTQSSEYIAAKVAFEKAGYDINECNVFYTIPISGSYIDGPSAGAVFTTAVYSAITNKQIRDDVAITGTIDLKGNIGPVGGFYEKVRAAYLAGKKYFITSVKTNRDYLIISTVKEKYNLTMVHVDNVDQLMEYACSDNVLPSVGYIIQHSDTNVKTIPSDYEFMPVIDGFSNNIITQSEIISPSSSLLKGIVTFMVDDIEYQQNLADKGYMFTSANNLFLHYTDLLFIEYLTEHESLLDYTTRIGNELDNYNPRTAKNLDNFDYVAGGYMRYTWAQSNYESVKAKGDVKGDERYSYAYDLSYAEAWIDVSRMLMDIKPYNSSEFIDERKVKPLAEKWTTETKELMTESTIQSSDVVWHYTLAMDDFNNKEYITAIYECAFAQALQKTADTTEPDTGEVLTYVNYHPSSLWGELYYGQGMYLLGTDDTASAYKLFMLAKYFDDAHNQVYDVITDNSTVDTGVNDNDSAEAVPLSEQAYNLCEKQRKELISLAFPLIIVCMIIIIFQAIFILTHNNQ